MALDHYVSQVYLRKFYSPQLGNRMFAIRKRDLTAFTSDARSVCRIPEGSTNTYLLEPRVIEEFLRDIEPKYNEAVSKIAEESFDASCLYALSGFIAYVLTCSPAGIRLQSAPLESFVAETGRRLEAKKEIPAPPPELGSTSFTELIERGVIKVEIDPKYPQAIGIAQILELTNTFGNFTWEILLNRHEDSPYFTSDFPIAIETTTDPRIVNRIVPLSPTIAVRIRPDLNITPQPGDFHFQGFRRRVLLASRPEVMRINRQIVRCAEELVFYQDDYSWVQPFVRKNAPYRLQTRTHRIPGPTGTFLWLTLELVKFPKGRG